MNLERGGPCAVEANGTNGANHNNGLAEIPRVKDVIGKALPKIGAYKQLDNTKQVVALIDDVNNILRGVVSQNMTIW